MRNRPRNLLELWLAGVFVAGALLVPGGAAGQATFSLGGIQVNESDQAAWSRTMAQAGFNTLQVTVYARQPAWDAPELLTRPVDEGTLKKIRAARAAGLEVALILRVEMDHAYPENRFLWHGLILPDGPAALDAWFDRYTGFVAAWAEAAEAEGVTLIGIASEMNALASTVPVSALPTLEAYYLDAAKQSNKRDKLVSRADEVPPERVRAPGDASPIENLRAFETDRDAALAAWASAVTYDGQGLTLDQRIERINQRRAHQLERWRELIREVRAVYSGRLTCAANFDNYLDIAFWPELDVMGINAYFPLRNPEEPATDDVLAEGWRGVWDEIAHHQEQLGVAGVPVVFTELGYTRRAGCTTAPWAWQGFDLVGDNETLMVWEELAFDPGERVRAMAALDRVNRERGGPLAGLLYWKLTATEHHAEIEPFALWIGDGAEHDPLLPALLEFLEPVAEPPPKPPTRPHRPADEATDRLRPVAHAPREAPGHR
ncbi:MAG: hypothetical protein AAFX76_11585 [Planctomycetota bacterium]